MQNPAMPHLLHFVAARPLLSLLLVVFFFVHQRLANRLGCFGFFRNLLYGVGCAVVTVGLFYLMVLLGRYAHANIYLLSQVFVGFASSAIMVVLGRFVFAQRSPVLRDRP